MPSSGWRAAGGASRSPSRWATGGVGARLARYDAVRSALGERPFVDDLDRPGLLHGALRLSDHARARVRRIDTARAQALPGVVAVVTARRRARASAGTA